MDSSSRRAETLKQSDTLEQRLLKLTRGWTKKSVLMQRAKRSNRYTESQVQDALTDLVEREIISCKVEHHAGNSKRYLELRRDESKARPILEQEAQDHESNKKPKPLYASHTVIGQVYDQLMSHPIGSNVTIRAKQPFTQQHVDPGSIRSALNQIRLDTGIRAATRVVNKQLQATVLTRSTSQTASGVILARWRQAEDLTPAQAARALDTDTKTYAKMEQDDESIATVFRLALKQMQS